MEQNQQFSILNQQKQFAIQASQNTDNYRTYLDLFDYECLDASMMLDKSIKDLIKHRFIRQNITSQCIFYFQIYLEILQKKCELKNTSFPQQLQNLKIGIIGCGTMGRLIANSLIPYLGWIIPSNIYLSSRRVEQLLKYQEIGISVVFDNDKVVDQCDIVFFCFPPSLDNWPILELKQTLKTRLNDNKKTKPMIVSIVSNLLVNKLKSIINLDYNIFQRSYLIPSLTENHVKEYDQFVESTKNLCVDKAYKDRIQMICADDSNLQIESLFVANLINEPQILKDMIETFQKIFSLEDDNLIQNILFGEKIEELNNIKGNKSKINYIEYSDILQKKYLHSAQDYRNIVSLQTLS